MNTLNPEILVPSLIIEDIKLNNKNTCISQLCILTIKSLLPLEEEIGNGIEYKRFKEELGLWKEYTIGESFSLLNCIERQDGYLDYFDDIYYSRLLPLVVANKDFQVMNDEVIKNILYFSGDINNLFEWLLVGIIIYLLIESTDDIVEILKEYIINFTQMDFMDKYGFILKDRACDITDVYKIAFEREKISLISILNGVKSSRYKYLQDMLKVLEGEEAETPIGRIVSRAIGGFELNNIDKIYLDMNAYIIKLRNGRINIDNLRIREYVLPDVFEFAEGDVFFHSLLNRSKIIKKEVNAQGITSLVATKTGNYLFKRDPSK